MTPAPIRVLQPFYGPEEIQALRAVIERRWTGAGPEVEALEGELAEHLGARASCVVAVNSCSAALELACRVAGLRPGTSAITTPLSFVATAHAIALTGAEVRFADVGGEDLNLDPGAVAALAGPPPRVILPVHLAGMPCDMARLWALAEAAGADVIEDCAHGAGSDYRHDRAPVGSSPRSRFACFSFNALKNIGAGDGGAVVCRDEGDAAAIRRLRWSGIDRETHARVAGGRYRWAYAVTEVCGKHQMNELSAAVGRVQLRKLARHNARRAEIGARYRAGLGAIPDVVLPAEPSGRWSRHLFIVRVPAKRRDAIIDYLAGRGIGASVHYLPLNLHAPYAACTGPTPTAHEQWRRLVSLPMHPGLGDWDADRVIAAVRGAMKSAEP